jgi:hypothetical protein
LIGHPFQIFAIVQIENVPKNVGPNELYIDNLSQQNNEGKLLGTNKHNIYLHTSNEN